MEIGGLFAGAELGTMAVFCAGKECAGEIYAQNIGILCALQHNNRIAVTRVSV